MCLLTDLLYFKIWVFFGIWSGASFKTLTKYSIIIKIGWREDSLRKGCKEGNRRKKRAGWGKSVEERIVFLSLCVVFV